VTVTVQAGPEQAPDSADSPDVPLSRLRTGLRALRVSDRFWGWAAPLIVTAIGGFVRFWNLNQPPKLNFDEAYYVKQAYSMLKWGYERRWIDNADKATEMWNNGQYDAIWTREADFVVHPPLGKWMIAVGEQLFGVQHPWAWRFSVALCGTLSILMLARIARRLFNSTLLGTTAGLLLAVDGQHFTQSRTGLLDLLLMFWALAGFGFILIDRDRSRARLSAWIAAGSVPTWGHLPRSWWWRPWRLAAAVSFGLAAAVKWSGLYVLVTFAVATVLWDLATLRSHDAKHWWASIFPNGAVAFVTMVPTAIAAYLATWTGWFLSRDAWDRHWSPDNTTAWVDGLPAFIRPTVHALRGLWHYHVEAYNFHVGVGDYHPWEANPWSWIVQTRPTMFWLDGAAKGCGASSCTEAVDNMGNPVIWWGATIGILVLLFCWVLRRDWRAGAILAGLAAGYLPWFHYQERTIFTFYSVAFAPWVVLAFTYCLGLLLGRPGTRHDRRYYGALAAGALVVTAVALFGYFYPIYSGDSIPTSQFDSRIWLPAWK
jgi:dolichyl-phosphate-mannose-protein mannosyltransferase